MFPVSGNLSFRNIFELVRQTDKQATARGDEYLKGQLWSTNWHFIASHSELLLSTTVAVQCN